MSAVGWVGQMLAVRLVGPPATATLIAVCLGYQRTCYAVLMRMNRQLRGAGPEVLHWRQAAVRGAAVVVVPLFDRSADECSIRARGL